MKLMPCDGSTNPFMEMCLKGNANQLLDAHLCSFFPCFCITHYKSVLRISDMIASMRIFAEAHADGALAFGIITLLYNSMKGKLILLSLCFTLLCHGLQIQS